MTALSLDYHDYVFQDGRLIGDFEEMYCNSAEVPWHQDQTAHDISADVDIAILQRHSFDRICDLGCGLGYFTARLQRELSTEHGARPNVIGLEISPTAVATASRRFPEIRFMTADLLDRDRLPPGEDVDLVVAKDVIWYVCQELDKFLTRSVALVGNNSTTGMLLISQSFPNTEHWVGQDVVAGPDELLRLLRQYVEVVYYCAEHDKSWAGGFALHVLARVK